MRAQSILLIVALTFLCSKIGAQPDFMLAAEGFDSHVELVWPPQTGASSYKVFRSSDGQNFSFLKAAALPRAVDFVGHSSAAKTFSYRVDAIGDFGAALFSSKTASATVVEATDSALLDMAQRATLRYFTDGAHPVSGMARERTSSGDIVTTGGTGFGIMALVVGAQRGWLSRAEARDRTLKIAAFLSIADRFHGVFPHWMNGQTGNVVPFSSLDDGGDLVETAFLMQGLLTARQYFDDPNDPVETALRQQIQQLWEAVEWDFYGKNGSDALYWHWSPNNGWAINFALHGYYEATIAYILGIASPTHPVPASLWSSGWCKQPGYTNGGSWYGRKLWVGPNLGGPMFWAHYSFLGFDPRGKKDAFCNYFEQSRNHALINQAWCAQNPKGWAGYSAECWGLTACDVPTGYFACAAGSSTDIGTIAPTAALASMPYVPAESMAALKHFYRQKGAKIWDWMGFRDAFDDTKNWVASDMLAIDQGPIVCMIENHRSGLLWQLFMSSPEIQPALDAIGFVPDGLSAHSPTAPKNAPSLRVQPNPMSEAGAAVSLQNASEGPSNDDFLEIFDSKGRLVERVFWAKGEVQKTISLAGQARGLYFFKTRQAGAARAVKN